MKRNIVEIRREIAKLLTCEACNGCGAKCCGENYGVYECDECGGDGHRIYNMEGTHLTEILYIIFNKDK